MIEKNPPLIFAAIALGLIVFALLLDLEIIKVNLVPLEEITEVNAGLTLIFGSLAAINKKRP